MYVSPKFAKNMFAYDGALINFIAHSIIWKQETELKIKVFNIKIVLKNVITANVQTVLN